MIFTARSRATWLFISRSANSAGEEVVLPLIEMLWLQAGPFLALSLTMPGVRWTARHHQTAIAALRAGNGAAARRAIEADIEETSEQLLAKAVFAQESAAVAPLLSLRSAS